MIDLLDACCNCPELWEGILSSIQQIILLADTDGSILFISPAVEKILGFTSDELKGKAFSAIFTEEDLICMYPNLLYMAQKKNVFEGEIMVVRKDGSRMMAYMIARPCHDGSRNKTVLVICLQDIHKEKELEKAYTQTRYQDLLKIANGIAHEIRNPLVGIGGFVNRLFKACGGVKDQRQYYDLIMNNLNKIENLVKKVQFFAQLPKPTLRQSSVSELIDEALHSYRQEMEKRGIELVLDLEETTLRADRDLVIRTLSILIDNAMDALSGGGRIAISVEEAENQCIFSVSDTGTGIADEDISYIFNPFFSTKSNGAGIDLAAVKRIMESHGGRIEVKTKKGEGSTFTLVFPMERRRSIRVSRLQDMEKAHREETCPDVPDETSIKSMLQ